MTAPLFRDVEAWAVNYLRDALAARPEPVAAGATVDLDTPSPRPPKFVTIRRDGGPQLDTFREAVRLGINVWAENDWDAADLTQIVRHLMAEAPNTGGPVRNSVETAGPSPIADESEQPRRYFAVELTVRAL